MTSEVFNSESVAVIFQWNDPSTMSDVSYNVSISPTREVMITGNSAQLTVLYNTRYTVRITAIICAREGAPYLGESFYGIISETTSV